MTSATNVDFRNESRTKENMAAGDIVFSEAELKELNDFLDGFEVKGGRYPEFHSAFLWG